MKIRIALISITASICAPITISAWAQNNSYDIYKPNGPVIVNSYIEQITIGDERTDEQISDVSDRSSYADNDPIQSASDDLEDAIDEHVAAIISRTARGLKNPLIFEQPDIA